MIVVLTSYNAIQSTEQESLIASLCMIMWQTGNRFLFFDYESQAAYITPTCFSVSIRYAVLWTFQKWKYCYKNEHSCLKHPSDTLSIDSKVTYVPFNCNNES